MSEDIPQDALQELQNGNKITAIKIVREATGLGLKEAKDLIEARIDSDSLLKSTLDPRTITITPLTLLLGFDLIALAVYLASAR